MTTTRTVDTHAMTQLILDVEARANSRGWDKPPAFYVLYDPTDAATEDAYRFLAAQLGAPIRSGGYAAQEAIPPAIFSGSPSHGLFRMAFNLAYSDHPPALVVAKVMAQPGFVGAAFMCEGWQRSYQSRQAYDQERSTETRRLADIPGSIEQRSVFVHLVDGTDLMVVRRRGQAPISATRLEGSVIESLRTIVAVVAGLPLPPVPTLPSGWVWPS